MADIYTVETTPSKAEVLASVLDLEVDEITVLATYRFDDPVGEVGMEVFIVQIPDAVVQIPLTYRGAPLAEAQVDDLVAELEHAVLGKRYVYFGSADPVFAEALVSVINEQGTGAPQYRVTEGSDERTEITEGLAQVNGTGAIDTDIDDEDNAFEVVEMFAELELGGLPASERNEPGQLIGTWAGQETPVLLAHIGVMYDDEFENEEAEN